MILIEEFGIFISLVVCLSLFIFLVREKELTKFARLGVAVVMSGVLLSVYMRVDDQFQYRLLSCFLKDIGLLVFSASVVKNHCSLFNGFH